MILSSRSETIKVEKRLTPQVKLWTQSKAGGVFPVEVGKEMEVICQAGSGLPRPEITALVGKDQNWRLLNVKSGSMIIMVFHYMPQKMDIGKQVKCVARQNFISASNNKLSYEDTINLLRIVEKTSKRTHTHNQSRSSGTTTKKIKDEGKGQNTWTVVWTIVGIVSVVVGSGAIMTFIGLETPCRLVQNENLS